MRGELGQIRAQAQLDASASELSSRKVFEVRGLTHGFDTQEGRLTVVRDLDLRIVRGDRVGLIGPNGAGKTTLLRLILGELAPDQGTSWRSPAAEIAYLDQTRARLNSQDTLWDTLAPYGGDQIMVQGQPRHVAAYAKDFLFRPEQMRQPVGALSGGERNRLTLALALARPSNVLVLDEPTNDLDMDTLDLLEDMLEAYEGTLILVSHDRSFLDNVVTSCLCAVGNGAWMETAGGYSDALSQLGRARLAGARLEPGSLAVPVAATASTPTPSATPKRAAKLSFKDTHRLKEIDALIPALNTEIARLERELSDPALFTRKPDRFKAASTRLLAARSELARAEEDWLEIEARREALEQG
jgi:ATP-binding cassette subfamily F protein uup